MNDNIKKLYDELKGGGADVGSPNEFNNWLSAKGEQGYKNRLSVYNELKNGGADVGSYDDFRDWMGFRAVKPSKPTSQTVAPKPAPAKPSKQSKPKGTPMTEAERQNMLNGISGMVAQSKAGLQRTKNRMNYAKANTGLRVPGVTLGVKGGGVHLGQNSKVVETKPQYNADSGKVERSYITESGNEYEERGGADLEQNAIDEARFQTEQQEAYLLREKHRIEQEMNQRGRELDAEAVDFSWRDMPRGSGGAIHTYNSSTVNGRLADTKYKSLLAQLNKVNDGLATLAEAKKGKASDQWIDDSSNWASKKGKQLLAFGAGAWRGLAHAVGKVSTWDMGMTDMATNSALYTAAVDADRKGIDNISREDRDLLDITAYTNAIHSENEQYLGRGYKAGQVTGESLPFMIEMMLNPASKLGTTATNKLMREAVKRYGKDAVKKATKKYLAAKIGTRLMGDAVGSMAMAGTTGQGHVTADMLNRLTGDVQFKEDDSGKIVYGGREGAEDSVLKAYMKAFGAQTIENHSEMVGEYFAPFLGKAASLTRKGMDKIGLGKVNKLIDDIGATNAAKMLGDFEKHTKWNGTFGEYAEEVVGNIENALLVGDNTLDTAKGTGVFNADQNIDTFLGVSLMGGFFAGAKTLLYRGPKRRALNEMSDAGKVIDNAIGDNVHIMEKWGGWRNTFLVGTDEEKKAALREVMDNTDLPIKFRMGVLNFVKAAQKYEGIVRAQESKVKDGEQDPVAQSSDESYDNGYDTTEPEAMNDAKNMYDYKRQQMSAMVTDEFLADFDNDPVGTLSQVMGRDDFSEDEKQLALDYVNAKATYDGMIDRVRDDIDSRIEESNATVNSRTNRNDGMIHPATLKLDDRKVYIVDGTINMQDDGSMVDVSNSSESILVRDAETGKLEFMSPSDVLSTDESIDPATEKEAAQQALREQYAQEQSDRIDGVLAFNVGDTYDLTDEHGQQWSAQIVADNGDGTVQVAWNGDPNSISTARKDELQSMRDIHNRARINDYEQQRAAQRQEQQAEAAEPQRRTYNLNDEITLRDEEGNPVRGSITAEENEDGEIEVYTEQPINGKQVQLLRRDELDNMLLEQNGEVVENVPSEETPSVINLTDDESEDNAGTPVTAEEGAEGATLEPASATSEEQNTEEEQHTEPMPMIGEGEDAEPDFASVTPQRAHDYIFNESGLDEEDAKDFMTNNLRAAETAVTKIKNNKPKMGTSIAKFNKNKAEWQRKLDEANANLDYWQQVKAERNAVLAERAKAQQEADKKQTEEAQAAEAAYREEMAKKEAEQAALGTNTVSPAIRDKWNAAPKVEGAQNEIVLANGEKVAGRYYLVESGAATPSHNSANGFAKSEGFPIDKNGGSVNDRDYERDKDAQQITRDIANKYDSRAMQTPVVVSQDGVVLSGNGRTMAGELAAAQGTDAEYNEHLAKYPTQYGFTSEQVKGMQHPRVVFVPDAAMPYTADTFAKFNQQEMKGQSKTEHSVKLGKVVDDETFNRIISLINRFDTLGDFYADFAASREAIGELFKCGAISRPQMAEMIDGDGLSAIGKETLENMLIGKAFESNPDAVREATEFKQMRQTIIQALAEISNNISLGKDYSLESELAEAIDLVYKARKSGFKAGDRVSSYARQQQFDFYGVPSTVADYKNATMLMIADILNDNRSTLLKKYLQLYNTKAKDAANGQLDIFSGTVASKESILNDINELLNYGTEEEQKKAAQEAVEKRKAESVAEAGVIDNGSEGSNEDNDRVEETPAEQAPTEEDGSKPVMSHDEKMAFMRQFLEDTAGDMRLLDVVTDEEMQKLIDLYDAWEVVNDGLGAAHDANDALLNDKNKAIAQKAKENIETAENAANAAFATVEDYYNELLSTHNIEDEEGDADETETPSAETPLSDAISAAEAETDQNPTDGQKEAGNYKKGHVQVGTFDITIENPKGSVRRGKDANGKEWESKMNNTYGYFRGTEGVDGDHIDVFISNDIDGWDGRKIFVVDQYNPDGSFAEHKVMLGFNDADDAKSDYLANYEKGWENGRRIDVSAVNLEDFEKWIASSKRKTKAFSEYSSVKKETVGNSFDDFVRDSGDEVIPNGVTRSNVINFAERVLEKYPSHTESYDTYNAKRTDVEIPADKLFKSESDWFTAKNGNFIAVNDTQAKACYELVAHKDAQGHLKSVSVIKYHSFDNALTDEEVVAITDAMKANATVAPTVEINDANWKESVDTPIGAVKMGENQKAKLFAKGREQQYGMLLETLSNPDVVLEENDKEQNMFHERPSSYLFVKTFQKEDGSKFVHFESVTVSQEGMEVSISSHIIRENQLKNKLKSDRLLYKATALDAPANTSAEQPIVGGSLSSDGKDTEKDSSDQENGVKSFKITPKEYTTKRGKKLSMHLVTFESELTKEQMNAAKKLAKDAKGWWSKEDGGFLMRDMESAQKLADSVLDDADAVADAQPVSLIDMQEATGAEVKKPKDSGNKLVTDERYAELKARMRKKLGQLNVGVDPEMLAIGTEMAVYHIEKGARKFTEYAKAMIEDLGEAIRPYLKAFYNGARDLPEVEANGWSEDLTPYDEVRTIDIANFDKPSVDAMATAEMVVKEQEAEQQAEETKKQISETRNKNRNETKQQTAADTQAITSEATAIASETESVIRTGEENAINEQVGKIDEALDKVNNQLALLGYYEADEDTDDDKRFRDSLPDATAEDKDLRYSLREQTAPKHTKTAYAVFIVKQHEDGSVTLHPKMIADEAVGAPPHTWLNADTGKIKRDKQGEPIQNTRGRVSVRDAKGAPLAWRPGKHLAAYPNASQFAVEGDTKGVRDRLPDNVVFFEVEYAADRDYQLEAWEYGVNGNGKYEHSQAGLPYIPKDGYYIYRTNANPNIPAMIITGAYRVKRALTDEEAKKLNQEAGGEWYDRKSGEPMTAERLKELGLDEAGLQRKAETFDYNELEPAHDESSVAMSMPGYVRRDLDFTDKNLLKAIKENKQDASYYQSLYEQQKKDERQREQTAFEDGQVLPIEMDWRNGGYKVEGLNAIFANKDRLLDAFRTKYESYVATFTGDGNSIEVSPWRSVLAETKKPRRRNGKPTKKEQAKAAFIERETRRAVESVSDVAKKLGLNVEVKTDTEGLTGRRARAKGWYDTKTGKIVIILPNHTSGQDVMRTILHEGVAHHGLRELFGEDFDTFLENVYNNASKEIREAINRLAAKNDWDFKVATEEYLAGMAEDTNFDRAEYQSWWGKIKFLFLDMLRKAGLVLNRTLTDADLRYILWRSYRNLNDKAENSIIREAEDISKQMDLKVGNFAETDNSAASVADGDSYMYRDGDVMDERDRAIVRDRYERTIQSGMYQFREAVQDCMLSLRRLMEYIAEATGEKVKDFENAYMAENALSSKNHAEQDLYGKLLFNPMLDELHNLAKENSSRDEVTRYMMAKHGLERNEVMARRAAEQTAMDELGKDLRAAERAVQNDPLDQDALDALDDVKQRMQDRVDELYKENRERDYGGITGLMGEDDLATAESLAKQFVLTFEGDHDVDQLWGRVNACTKATLEKTYKAGLLSKAGFDEINSMYEYYIPLRGFDATTSDEVYSYLTHEKSGFNSPLKKAEGRKSIADDPIATIANMADCAIVQGNRNMMKQKFLKFAMNHPSDAVSVNKMWLRYDDVQDQWEAVTANIDENDSADDVLAKTEAFEEQMRQLAESDPDHYKRGKDAANIPYIALGKNLNEHQVHVKMGGEDYILTINGSPRVAQALNGLTNPDNENAGGIGKYINRQMSAFYTTRNPEFVLSNFLRDALYANSTMWVRETPNYAIKFNKNFLKCNPAMLYKLLQKHNSGTLDMNNEMERAFHQFMMNGGETGYTVVKDIEKQKKLIKKYVRMKDASIPVEAAWKLLGDKLDDINRSVENCARFAAYLTSRQMGRSVERSVWDAKEVSVNFNKKGAGAKFRNKTGQGKWYSLGNQGARISGIGRSFYVFWNASVQGTTNFASLHKHHTAKALAMDAGLFLLGAMLAGIGGGDDDDYWNLPSYVRRSNICFKIPGTKSFCSIPLGIEQRAIYGLGELFSSVASGKERMSDMEIAKEIAGSLSSMMPLDMMEDGSSFMPSYIKPYTEAYISNKDWKGMPIYRKTPYNEEDPEWTKASKRTNQLVVDFSKWCNKVTGGDDVKRGWANWNPSKLEHLFEGVFGGISTTVNKMVKAGEMVAGKQDFDWSNILLASRVIKSGDENAAAKRYNAEYWKYCGEYRETKRLVDHYENQDSEGIIGAAEKLDFMYNSPEYGRYEIVDEYYYDVKELSDELKETTDDQERKELEAEINTLKQEMVMRIRAFDDARKK